ncbi:hypothetical protein QMG90_13610 [Trabulsiella odontotermitis]|uniref:hypothetical protein n=1 Tax=Trabulsiella odontotermitis TaxID=379893 RepID=UPI0024B6B48A|nr:hypothetical protein [Trabulsiella odontotermitis]WHP29836.1 hypothetical protein QMG90_13610 [Trabulsiella odontotermitis]
MKKIVSIFSLAVILLLSMKGITYIDFSEKDMIKSIVPAWIQAIGSILAIIIAGMISANQIKHEKQLEKRKVAESDLAKMHIVRALIIRSLTLMNEVRTAMERGEKNDFQQVSPWTMRNTKRAIDNLNLFEVPEGMLALDLLAIGPSLEEIAKLWEQCMQESLHSENHTPTIDSYNDLDEASQEVLKICEAAFKLATQEVNRLLAIVKE